MTVPDKKLFKMEGTQSPHPDPVQKSCKTAPFAKIITEGKHISEQISPASNI